MNATVLWVVLIGSVSLVLTALGYLVARLWRLYRTVRRVVRETGAAAGPVAAGSALAAERTAGLSQQGEEIAAQVARLRASLARLNLVAAALHEGRAPYQRVRSYVSK